jgi:hypothetical protein
VRQRQEWPALGIPVALQYCHLVFTWQNHKYLMK